MTYTTLAAQRPSASFAAPSLGLWRVVELYQNHRSRKALYALSDRQLDDIGLVRADIDAL